MNTAINFANKDMTDDFYYDLVKNIYKKSYFKQNNYIKTCQNNAAHDEAKAKIIKKIFPNAKKILIGGAAQGYLVALLNKQGFDCYGFDPLYHFYPEAFYEVCEEDALPRMKAGFCEKIPFEKDDDFDTFVTFDVLEHICQNFIVKVAKECERMQFKQMLHVIGTSDNIVGEGHLCEGHIIFRDKNWWADQFRGSNFKDVTSNFVDSKYWPVFKADLPGGLVYENSSYC